MPPVERASGRHARRDAERRRGRRAPARRSPSGPASSCSSTGRGGQARRRPRRAPADIAVVLGGDGTMLRALTRFLDTGVPVLGANFGRVGFLTAIAGDELEPGLARVFARRVPRASSCRRSRSSSTGERHAAVNDAVVVSGTPGRIDRARRTSIGGEDLGTQPCDGAHLRDAARLDRLQPLERRPGARLGPRRGGGHVRRAAHAARAPARRRARPRPRGRRTARRTSRRSCSSTATASARLAPRRAGDGAVRHEPHARSRRCPSRRSSAATARSSAPPESAGGNPSARGGLWSNRHRDGTKPDSGRTSMDLEGGGDSAPTRVGVRRASAAWRLAAERRARSGRGVARLRRLDRSAATEPCRHDASAAMAASGRPGAERTIAAVGCSPYDERGAAAASHREPRPDPRGRARARRRAERDHRRDRRGQDDPLERDRPAARGARRRRDDRRRRRRGVRRGRVRPARRRGARRARRAAARGRGDARARAADLRRRADARLRVGPQRRARGRRRGGRGAARDERPVRAAAAGAAELPARGARRVRRDRRTRRARRAARGASSPRPAAPARRADARRRGRRSAARRAARARRRTPRASPPAARTSSAPSASGSATSPSSRREPRRRSPRSRPTSDEGAADLVGGRRAGGRAARARSRPSSPRPARRSARRELSLRETSHPTCGAFLDSLEAEPGRLEAVEAELERIADLRRRYRRRRPTTSCSSAPPRRGAELDALADGHDPARAAAEALAAAEAEVDRLHAELRRGATRRPRRGSPRRSPPSSRASASARASSAPTCRAPSRAPSGRRRGPRSSSARTPACRSAPVAETASGGELSRIALAIAAVGGGETMVFDEIDAGIGGQTAHAVGETLRRLAGAGAGDHDHAPAADREPRRPPLPRREGRRATRRTRASSRSTPTSGARSSSACSAAPTSSPRCASERAERRARAARARARTSGRFLAEPHHLADWWPGIVGVEPDRRGFATGASAGRSPGPRTQTRPRRLRRPSAVERPQRTLGDRDARRHARSSRSSAGPGSSSAGGKACASCDRSTPRCASSRPPGPDARSASTVSTPALFRWTTSDERTARTAAGRLYDLVQTAASF